MKMPNNFLGHDGFIWFIGVVEDRDDPTKTGRVRVRCLGYHTDDKNALPTSDLPWASVMLPITSSGISGIGQSPLGLVEGSWVIGFFKDGQSSQEPIVLGSLPGQPSEYGHPSKGFYDPNTAEGLYFDNTLQEGEGQRKVSVYPRYIDEPDNNRLAVNEVEHSSIEARELARITNIPSAAFEEVNNAKDEAMAASSSQAFDTPENTYSAEYPFNHVYESESGHLLEFDDTAASQRVHLRHNNNTGIEFTGNGNRVDTISNDLYSITTNDSYAYINGHSTTTINGRHKLYINSSGTTDNNYDIQIGPNANINIQVDKGNINLVTKDGNINMNSATDFNLLVNGNMTTKVKGYVKTTIEGKNPDTELGLEEVVTEKIKVTGKTIDLN